MQGTVRWLLWDFLYRYRLLTDTIGKPTPAFLADQFLYTKEAESPLKNVSALIISLLLLPPTAS
jgi:hypothetical protein